MELVFHIAQSLFSQDRKLLFHNIMGQVDDEELDKLMDVPFDEIKSVLQQFERDERLLPSMVESFFRVLSAEKSKRTMIQKHFLLREEALKIAEEKGMEAASQFMDEQFQLEEKFNQDNVNALESIVKLHKKQIQILDKHKELIEKQIHNMNKQRNLVETQINHIDQQKEIIENMIRN